MLVHPRQNHWTGLRGINRKGQQPLTANKNREWSFVTVTVVFHQSGLSEQWSFIRVVSHDSCLSLVWSFMTVVFYQGRSPLKRVIFHQGWSLMSIFHRRWSLMTVVFRQRQSPKTVIFHQGQSLMSSLTLQVVSHDSGLSSVMRAVFHKGWTPVSGLSLGCSTVHFIFL